MQTVDGKDTISIGLTIQGTRYDAVFHKNRFEKVMDKVDNSIHRGKDLETIKRKYAEHLVSIKPHVEPKKAKPVKTAAPTEFDKVDFCTKILREYPSTELGTLCKTAVTNSHGQLTYANARYIFQKLQKGK
jgi:hypothetical protein